MDENNKEILLKMNRKENDTKSILSRVVTISRLGHLV